MTTAPSGSLRRFSKSAPCPICGGYDQAPRSQGQRCYGFLSSDSEWAHCTRPEHAGGLEVNPSSKTYAHRLRSECRCGNTHTTQTLAPVSSNGHKPQIVATYDYRDEEGRLLFQAVRTEPKGFFQRRPGDRGAWINGIKGVRRALYRLPELVEADRDQWIFVPEGEKDVDALISLGLNASCNAMGAGKWSPEYNGFLQDRHVVVIPDNDTAGKDHARAVANSLFGTAASVRYLELPGLPEHGDVSDWLVQGHDVLELLDLVDATPIWSPSSGDSGEADGQDAPVLQVSRLSDVAPQQVGWYWQQRLPRGKLVIWAGDPGLGKSNASLDVTARFSLGGPWPDGGYAPLADVVLVSAEDGLADTIRPRLDALGADVSRIHAVGLRVRHGQKDLAFSLQDHLPMLEELIVSRGAMLLVVDPLLAFIGKVDSHKTAEVRALLAALSDMGDRTGCTVLAIIHLNKKSGEANSIYRITASLDFVAAARAVFLIGRHPDDDTRRVLAPVKCNLSAPPASLAFRFTTDGHFAWDGAVDLDANSLLAPKADLDEQSVIEEAMQFLLTVLKDGKVESNKILKEAKTLGISDKTVRRAKDSLGVQAVRIGMPGQRGAGTWFWRLPDLDGQTPGEREGDHLNDSGHLNTNNREYNVIGRVDGQQNMEFD